MGVPTFGNLRITGYVLLPAAYRSLSRPSSAPDAKAFSLRSFQLDLITITDSSAQIMWQPPVELHTLSRYPFNGKTF